MSDIVWEDPPVNPRNLNGKWNAFAAELREHPGKWAIAMSGATYSGKLSTQSQSLKARGCEATIRRVADGTYTLFARWPESAT